MKKILMRLKTIQIQFKNITYSIFLFILFFCSMVLSAETIVELLPIADATIDCSSPNNNYGSISTLTVESRISGEYDPKKKICLRFELPEGMGELITAAKLKLVRSNLAPWQYSAEIYGLNDDVANQIWNQTQLTWNNAPANELASNLWDEHSVCFLDRQVLNGYNWGGYAGEEIVFESLDWDGVDEFVSFLNTDSDRVVNLLITTGFTANYRNSFASSENATYEAPRLIITYGNKKCDDSESFHFEADVNSDCYVDMTDFTNVAAEWLECTIPSNSNFEYDDVQVTVTLEAVADAEIVAGNPDAAVGFNSLYACQNSELYPERNRKIYMRFALPDDVESIDSATFKITPCSIYKELWYWTYNIHGLKDNSTGQDWIEGEATGAVTWNNAPANNQANGFSFTEDATGVLGNIIGGGQAGQQREMSEQDLIDFLNTDTDGQVTLMMARSNNSTAHSNWASREHATLPSPKLEITYSRLSPEPSCGDEGTVYLQSDINRDCYTDVLDVEMIALRWLYCSEPAFTDCDKFYKEPTSMQLASERWNNWRLNRDKFPTAGWDFINTDTYGEQAYQTYADANFSMIRVREENYQKALNAGLEILFGWWEQLHQDPDRLEYYMNYPSPEDDNVIGYFLDDEPDEVKALQCGERSVEVYAQDKRAAIPMVNHSLYTREMFDYDSPAYIIKTKYCLLTDGTTRSNFYGNLETNRMAALAYDIGAMAWVLTTHHVSGTVSFRQASESDVFWQVYSIVGYGCKGLWYYRYTIDTDGGSFLDSAQTPNELYYSVQSANAELHNIWPIVKHLRSTGVFHSHYNPDNGIEGARNFGNGWDVEIYEDRDVDAINSFDGDNFLLSTFENRDDESDTSLYVLIQNKRHAMNTDSELLQASCTFEMDDKYSDVYRYSPQNGSCELLEQHEGQYDLSLGGGKAVLLKFVP